MINCKNCGAPLSLEEEKCPYCGTPNPEAQEHLRKLSNLDKDYKKVRSEVISEARKSKRGYNLLIILLILLLGNIAMILLYTSSYEIADRITNIKYSDVEIKNTFDELLQEENYLEFYTFYDRLNLPYNKFREYAHIAYLCSDYSNTLKYISNYFYEEENYYDPLLNIAENIKNFKDDYNNYLRYYESELETEHLTKINNQFDQCLKQFLKLNNEDIASINDLNSSQLVLLIMGRLDNEE